MADQYDPPDWAEELVALAHMELVPDMARWPLRRLGDAGTVAACIMADHVAILPEPYSDPGDAWCSLPQLMRALVWHRNPSMAAYAAHAAATRRGRGSSL